MGQIKLVVLRHFVRAGRLETAQSRIRANTELMLKEPDCLFRFEGSPPGQPLSIVTLTAWKDAEALRAWKDKRALPPLQGESPYERLDELEIDIANHGWGKALATFL